MLGEESRKHKDFSGSGIFLMLEPKPNYSVVVPQIQKHHFCDASQQQMPGAKTKYGIWSRKSD